MGSSPDDSARLWKASISPMNPLLIKALAIIAFIAAAFTAGCVEGRDQVQHKWDDANVAQAKVAFDAAMESRAKEQFMQQQLNEAINAASEREKKIRADYAAANAAAVGLRDSVTTLRSKLSVATVEACRGTAESALAVFSECADQYREVAEAADRYGSSATTLNDAWPE